MRFTPKTEKEIAELGLWPVEPYYNFEIVDRVTLGAKTFVTSDTTSRKGYDMIMLVVMVYNERGDTKVIVDYLLESMPGKLRSATAAMALLEKYQTGDLSAVDFIGKRGSLKLRIEKDETGQYPDKNAIGQYVVGNTAQPMQPQYTPAGDAHLDDDIPFSH